MEPIPIQDTAQKAAAFVELTALVSGGVTTGITLTGGGARIDVDRHSAEGTRAIIREFELNGYIPGVGNESTLVNDAGTLVVHARTPELDENLHTRDREAARRATTTIQAVLRVLRNISVEAVMWSRDERETLNVVVSSEGTLIRAVETLYDANFMLREERYGYVTLGTSATYNPEHLRIHVTNCRHQQENM